MQLQQQRQSPKTAAAAATALFQNLEPLPDGVPVPTPDHVIQFMKQAADRGINLSGHTPAQIRSILADTLLKQHQAQQLKAQQAAATTAAAQQQQQQAQAQAQHVQQQQVLQARQRAAAAAAAKAAKAAAARVAGPTASARGGNFPGTAFYGNGPGLPGHPGAPPAPPPPPAAVQQQQALQLKQEASAALQQRAGAAGLSQPPPPARLAGGAAAGAAASQQSFYAHGAAATVRTSPTASGGQLLPPPRAFSEDQAAVFSFSQNGPSGMSVANGPAMPSVSVNSNSGRPGAVGAPAENPQGAVAAVQPSGEVPVDEEAFWLKLERMQAKYRPTLVKLYPFIVQLQNQQPAERRDPFIHHLRNCMAILNLKRKPGRPRNVTGALLDKAAIFIHKVVVMYSRHVNEKIKEHNARKEAAARAAASAAAAAAASAAAPAASPPPVAPPAPTALRAEPVAVSPAPVAAATQAAAAMVPVGVSPAASLVPAPVQPTSLGQPGSGAPNSLSGVPAAVVAPVAPAVPTAPVPEPSPVVVSPPGMVPVPGMRQSAAVLPASRGPLGEVRTAASSALTPPPSHSAAVTVNVSAPGTPGPSLFDSSSSVTPPPPPSVVAPAPAPLGNGRIRLEPNIIAVAQTATEQAKPAVPPVRSKVETVVAPSRARVVKGASVSGGAGAVPTPVGTAGARTPVPAKPGPPAKPAPKRTTAELIGQMDARLFAAVESARDISSFISRSKQDRVSNTLALLGLPATPTTTSESVKPQSSLPGGANAVTPVDGRVGPTLTPTVAAVSAAAATSTKGAPAGGAVAEAGRVGIKVEQGVITGAATKQNAIDPVNLARALGQERELSAAQREFHVSAGRIGKQRKRTGLRGNRTLATLQRAVSAEALAAATAVAPLALHVQLEEEFGLPVLVGTLLHTPVDVPRIRLRVAHDYPRGGASYALQYEPSRAGTELLRQVEASVAKCRTRALGSGVGVEATLKAWATATQAWAEAQVAEPVPADAAAALADASGA